MTSRKGEGESEWGREKKSIRKETGRAGEENWSRERKWRRKGKLYYHRTLIELLLDLVHCDGVWSSPEHSLHFHPVSLNELHTLSQDEGDGITIVSLSQSLQWHSKLFRRDNDLKILVRIVIGCRR